eukprot:gnl/TRDRNA2_/TRDRNA2_127711_c0_seq1.p1 gnl/TRDRNA2_/TRDRNA2_127711_c0~~gnl/TRDRNA2_/TRDRNA2_127711_c0_seq1.p1  ORF type:complete len:280 (-),score=26.22 gnl/TRDRNA2_/TRDRNA2_127711_c0_seq1:578-1417(-)
MFTFCLALLLSIPSVPTPAAQSTTKNEAHVDPSGHGKRRSASNVLSDGAARGRDDKVRTPPWLVGNCKTIWTSVSGYYRLPYVVRFGRFGHWEWTSPFMNENGAEIGEGMFLSAPVVRRWPNGSWAAIARDASRYSPGNVTTCCCMYVGAHGPEAPIVLSEYCNGNLKGKAAEPMARVCNEDASRIQSCPAENETLREVFGDPFIEVYSSCTEENAADADVGLFENIPVWAADAIPRHTIAVASTFSMIAGLMCFGSRLFRRSTPSEHRRGNAYLPITG